MGCLIALVALAVPRVLIVAIFLVTDWFGRGFGTRIWPALGFLFMPYATLAYLGAMLDNNHSLTGVWLGVFVLAVVVDVAHWGGGGRTYRRRTRR